MTDNTETLVHAVARIQQLEAELAQAKKDAAHEADMACQADVMNGRLKQELAQVRQERDSFRRVMEKLEAQLTQARAAAQAVINTSSEYTGETGLVAIAGVKEVRALAALLTEAPGA